MSRLGRAVAVRALTAADSLVRVQELGGVSPTDPPFPYSLGNDGRGLRESPQAQIGVGLGLAPHQVEDPPRAVRDEGHAAPRLALGAKEP